MTITKGRFEAEYLFSQRHPELPSCKELLNLAQLYLAHPDSATLGLIEASVVEVRAEMERFRALQ